jgi:hypothetical protein
MLSSFFKKPIKKVSPEVLISGLNINNPGIIGKNINNTFLNDIKNIKFREQLENIIDTNGFTPFMHVIEINSYSPFDLLYILHLAEEDDYSWLKLNVQNNNGDTAFMVALKMVELNILQTQPKYINFLQRFVKIDPLIINLGAKNKQGFSAFDIATMLDIESIKNYISENYEEFDTTQSGSEAPMIPSLTPTPSDFENLNISDDTMGTNLITGQEISIKDYLVNGIEQIEQEGIPERIREDFVKGEDGKVRRDENGKYLKEKKITPAVPPMELIISQDKSDLIVFKLGENFYLSKRSIFGNRLVNNSTLYECNRVTTGHKPTKEMVNSEVKLFNIKRKK